MRKTNTMPTKLIKPALAASALAVLAACQTVPVHNSALDSARSAYQSASVDPRVVRYAPVELEQARASLARAEAEYRDDPRSDEVEHLAYLASRRADLALARATQRAADERIETASTERERVLLEARTREAERARQDAERAAAVAAQQGTLAREAQERARELERQMQELQAKQSSRGLVVTLQDVVFDTGRAELRPGAYRTLQQLAQVLAQHPERRVRIEGFTDSTGSDELNRSLSERRAAAVRDALVGLGVSPDRIDIRAFGEAFPVASNDTPAGRQLNRRVEILMSDSQGRLAERSM
jgi:outer membrane protein OmpA-like peptidoglycan-associated protein